jgi:nicotinamidase-related amidase
MSALGALGPGTVHIAIDMQVLFTPPGRWVVPDMTGILPNIAAIARAHPDDTLFTRFVVPLRAGDAPGQWQTYYTHWSDFTGEQLAEGRLDLLQALQPMAPPDTIIDKPTHSAFEAPALQQRLQARGATTLVLTGVETDVCVLATALTAIDRGFRVVVVSDAVTSSSPQGHDAALRHILPRFDQQAEILDTATLLAEWRA